MSGVLTKITQIPTRYPLVRGMISYSIIWPSCSVFQEYIEHGRSFENIDWIRAARFGVFGTFLMAPIFYNWMRFTGRLFPKKDFLSAVKRAGIEQVTYGPMSLSFFFFGMSALEMKPLEKCVGEVKEKFWPTYKYGAIYWPIVQTFNFYFIPERNRMIFVSAASFGWTVFLAHQKAKMKSEQEGKGKVIPLPNQR